MLIYYRKKNVVIGRGSIFYNVSISSSSKGDSFIVGRNCCLTGCILLGHDASPATFLPELVVKDKVYLLGSRRSYRKEIKIGDNVFIGTNAIIFPGVCIGDNVVIGAGSVVVKNISGNSVVAGNPARVVKTIEDFKVKYQKLFEEHPERF